MAYKPPGVHPKVQAWYDALDPDARVEFDRKLDAAHRKLHELRWSHTTNQPDSRYLQPRKLENVRKKQRRRANRDKPRNHHIQAGPPIPPVNMDELLKVNGEGFPVSSKKVPPGKQIDLSKYIQDELSGGAELANFYLQILRMAGDEARKNGVWLSHRLQAAAWLGDRGWGKAKGDEEKTQPININITDYQGAQTPPPPKAVEISDDGRSAEIRSLEAEQDPGRDSVGETKEEKTLPEVRIIEHPPEALRMKNDSVVSIDVVEEEVLR